MSIYKVKDDGTLVRKAGGGFILDETPTQNSNNPVTSGGVYNAIAGKSSIMVIPSGDYTLNIGSYDTKKYTFDTVRRQKGTGITVSGGKINIVGNISFVTVSVNIALSSYSGTGPLYINIFKNGSEIDYSRACIDYRKYSIVTGMELLIPVSRGDYLEIYSQAGGYSANLGVRSESRVTVTEV